MACKGLEFNLLNLLQTLRPNKRDLKMKLITTEMKIIKLKNIINLYQAPVLITKMLNGLLRGKETKDGLSLLYCSRLCFQTHHLSLRIKMFLDMKKMKEANLLSNQIKSLFYLELGRTQLDLASTR